MTEKFTFGIHNISKAFDGIPALSDASADFENGKVNIIIGENASGKSTLIRIMSGVLKQDSGYLTVNGEVFVPGAKQNASFPKISAVYQNYTLVDELSVLDNLFLDDYPVREMSPFIDEDAMMNEYEGIMKNIGFSLNPFEKVRNLSYGEKRVVELARAISRKADIILFDEPTPNFTSVDLEVFYRFLEKLKERGTMIIYITHNISEALRIGDTFSVMNNGKLSVLGDGETIDRMSLLKLISGKEIVYRYPYIRAKFPPNDVLSVDRIFTDYLSGLSFNVCQGEVLGITGLLGSHKSDIGAAIVGDVKILSGCIRMLGIPLRIHSPKEALEHGIAYIHENIEENIIPDFLPAPNITLSSIEFVSPTHFINSENEAVLSQGFFKRLNIRTEMKNVLSRFLSRGTQQKVCVARALLSKANILVLNEPTQSVDSATKSDIYNLINDYKLRGGSVLLISSDFDEVAGMSDRVIIIKDGKQSCVMERTEITVDNIIMKIIS